MVESVSARDEDLIMEASKLLVRLFPSMPIEDLHAYIMAQVHANVSALDLLTLLLRLQRDDECKRSLNELAAQLRPDGPGASSAAPPVPVAHEGTNQWSMGATHGDGNSSHSGSVSPIAAFSRVAPRLMNGVALNDGADHSDGVVKGGFPGGMANGLPLSGVQRGAINGGVGPRSVIGGVEAGATHPGFHHGHAVNGLVSHGVVRGGGIPGSVLNGDDEMESLFPLTGSVPPNTLVNGPSGTNGTAGYDSGASSSPDPLALLQNLQLKDAGPHDSHGGN